jgi:hypothetical protein
MAVNAVPAAQVPCRMLSTAELLPGMVIARDLMAQDTIVLVGTEHVLTEKLIHLLRLREQRDDVTFVVAVRLEGRSS